MRAAGQILVDPGDRLLDIQYVDPGGRIAYGRLRARGGFEAEGEAVLLSGTGRELEAGAVRKLLAPAKLTEDGRAILWRAVRAGYVVEDA